MNPFPILIRIAAGFVLATLAACGGGGGGGGGGTTALVYSGNTSPAVVSATNASRLTANVIGINDAAGVIGGVSTESGDGVKVQEAGLVGVARRLSRDFRETVAQASRDSGSQRVLIAVPVPIDITEPCEGGIGTLRIFGSIDDVTFTGTVNVVFTGCLTNGVTLGGQGTMRIDAWDPFNPMFDLPTDSTMSFTRLTLRATGLSLDATGTLRDLVNVATNTETITANLVQLDNNTSVMTKASNLEIINVYNNISFPTSFTASITGQVFDSVHGFVDITTVTPFAFGTIAQLFPNSGQMLLKGAAAGAGNRTIRATALSSSMVRLELDLDGDNVFENDARMLWTQLGGLVGADLGDNEPDGMHNSWETFYGLNPAVDDATGDKDNDLVTNINEYMAGTTP